MPTPLNPTQILAAVQASGLNYYEMPGWRGRCRCHDGNHEAGVSPNGRAWGPINGVVVHHTAGPMNSGQAAIDYTINILNRGRTDTPGPLVQFSIDADGRVIIAAAGRSNQAGSVSQVAINHMIAADFSLTSPYQDVRGSDADGNTHTFGIEIQAPGIPNDAQVNAAERLSAAICSAYGWTGQETCAHGEIASSKAQTDPGLDMGAFRRAVMAYVSGSTPVGTGGGLPSGTVTPPPAPQPQPISWDGSSYPGSGAFVLGQSHPAVTKLGEMLVSHGFGGRYKSGPGPQFTEVDRLSTQDFQLSQGWTGGDADGYPGPESWARLSGAVSTPAPAPAPSRPSVSVSHINTAAHMDGPAVQGHTTYRAEVLLVENALCAEGLLLRKFVDGSAGTSTFGNNSAYQQWQLRVLGNVGTRPGQAADGYPGTQTMSLLGNKYGFDVNA